MQDNLTQQMWEWENRARQHITAVIQRLESHGDSCVPGCHNDARDRKAINEAIEFLETHPVRGAVCACTLATPCSDVCSCARGHMSGGCSRCATYGSAEQRLAAARRIATTPLPTFDSAGAIEKALASATAVDRKCPAREPRSTP